MVGLWLAWIVQSARIQRDAGWMIKDAGGTVIYDWTNRSEIPERKLWAPRWLVELVGLDYFGHVTDVGLSATRITDSELAQLRALKTLSHLFLSATRITDVGLAV